MSIEIMSELSCAHDYSITSSPFSSNISWSQRGLRKQNILKLVVIVFLPSLDVSLSCTRALLTVVCVTETYRMSG
jgi:hypothetical protein